MLMLNVKKKKYCELVVATVGFVLLILLLFVHSFILCIVIFFRFVLILSRRVRFNCNDNFMFFWKVLDTQYIIIIIIIIIIIAISIITLAISIISVAIFTL